MLALAAALLMALASASPSAASAHGGRHKLYWGANIGSQLTGMKAPWDMRAVSKFQSVAGKGLSLVHFLQPFAECAAPGACVMQDFPLTPMEDIRAYGAIPFLSWNSSFSPPSVVQPDFQLSDVIEGRYDAYITEFATKAATWGHPFFLRFDWEMNGFWFPWDEGVNGNNPGEFVAAWRHVHDIFTSVGATNATWVWCPNVNIFGDLPKLGRYYPGSRYVDWTCLDGFNWGKRRGSPGWLSFTRIFRPTYREIVKRIAPHKPMVIAEIASSEKGGSKPAWIRNMLRTVRTRFRKVRGLIWLDVNDRNTRWPIEKPRAVRNAFRSGIRNRAYLPNVFGSIGQRPIRAPGRG